MNRPLYARASPTFNLETSHAGLWYDKFCDRWSDAWTLPAKQKEEWIRTVAQETRAGGAALLGRFARRRQSMVEALGGVCLSYRTESRFVTGLGREHPVENGFIWHPTLGTPYLPGSSVKGLIRAYVLWEENEQRKAEADKILGRQESKDGDGGHAGAVVFFDAVPLDPVQLELDVMTPHYVEYYQNDEAPGDWLNPVPIPLLVVAAGTVFQFGIAPRAAGGKEHLATVEDWLKSALRWFGAGAKTAVGYGRFETGHIDRPGETATTAAVSPPRLQFGKGDKIDVEKFIDEKGKVKFRTPDGFVAHIVGEDVSDLSEGVRVSMWVRNTNQNPKGYTLTRKPPASAQPASSDTRRALGRGKRR